MADFTANIELQSKTAYKQSIEGLREKLGVKYSHTLRVLPFQENPPTHWFDVKLRTRDDCVITLRIRRGNLYLDGYRVDTTSGTWFEFGSHTTDPPPPHLIPGSSFLGFTGDYNSLENAAGVAGISNRRNSIYLGLEPLIGAINALANYPDRRESAKSLIIVIRMICESIRYARISNHIATNFTQESGFAPEDWMIILENNWGRLSFDLLQIDADPKYKFRPLKISTTEIESVEQAVDILGIILWRSQAQGQQLVEVFSVCINNFDGSLYGTITVTDGPSSQYNGPGSQYIYNRKKEDSQSIHSGDNASLTGPTRSISANDSFSINLALMDKNTDHVVSKGQISWNVYNTTNEYDKLLSENVNGEFGSVTVNYVVLSDAVEAKVEVTLENEATDYISGWLTIDNGVSEFESVFVPKTKAEEEIDVRAGERIRLSRSVVAVPLNSALNISYNDEITKNSARIPAQLSGTSNQIISSKHGGITLTVNWNSN